MQQTQPVRVRIGIFELDLRTGELRSGDATVLLREQPLQILRMLVEREGELVNREEIRKKLWPNDTIVEFDHSINSAIKNLRRALGDSADQPKYIETVARRGYRLLVTVKCLQPGPGMQVRAEDAGEQNGAAATRQPEAGGLIGRKISHYRVLEVIGAGGMGLVYKAEDLKLGRRVALKFLPGELARDSISLQRFEREARTASTLNHRNICTIYEVEEHDRQPCIVMELLEGETLRDRLAAWQSRPIPVDEMLHIAIQICEGLDAAHQRDIIHRDIKPANIFLTTGGQVKILDFGLAKFVAGESETANPTAPDIDLERACAASASAEPTVCVDHNLTRTGAWMGTAGYMSPEQVRGEKLDARTDIFSFGLVLYEAATGQRAFSGTVTGVCDSILHGSLVPVRELNSALPAALLAAIDKCLEKDPAQRFQRAAEVRTALEKVKRASDNKVSRRMRAALAVAVLVLVVLVVALSMRRARHAPHVSASSYSLQMHPLTDHGKVYRAVAATPDGSYIAYVKRESEKYELRLLQVATERDVQLLPGAPQQIRSLHFSRDGNFIYFLRVLDPAKDPNALGVFRIGTLGGPVTTLATDARSVDAHANSVTVSPDGKQIAYIAQTATESLIVAIDADGSNRRVLARSPDGSSFWFVEWSPSQDTLAAVADSKTDMVLFRIGVSARSMQDLSGSRFTIGQPAWSSDGTTIFAPAIDSSSPIMQIWAFDAHTGSHRALTSSSTSYDQWTLSATTNDDLIANTNVADLSLSATDQSGQPYPIPSLRGEGSESAIWVDNRVVTSSILQMVVHDPDGRNPTKLQTYSSSVIYRQLARCGPDQVVYWADNAKRQSHIARTNITTGSSSALTDGPIDGQPACTADGSSLVFVRCSDKENRCALTRKSLDSGQSLDLYQFNNENTGNRSPSISSDGKSVLFWRYIRDEDAREGAAIIPISGGEVRTVRMPIPVNQFVQLRWSPDAKSIVYPRNEGGVGNIWSVPLTGGAPRRITNFDSDQRIFDFDISPDNRLVISRGNWVSDVVLIKKVKEAADQPSTTAN